MIQWADVERAQGSWGAALVAVGEAPTWPEAHGLATGLVREHYHLTDGSLLFCPTKVTSAQFRSTLEGAVSYFVGRDPDHPEDPAFALEPWTAVRFENAGIVSRDDVAMAMGNYFFERRGGTELKAEFSFVYIRDGSGDLKIQLHHSALPYSV